MNSFFKFILQLVKIIISSKAGTIGIFILGTGVILIKTSFQYSITYFDNDKFLNITANSGEVDFISLCVGLLLIFTGLYMLIQSHRKIMSEKSLIYFANTLNLGNSAIPYYAMDKNDRINAIPCALERIDSYNKVQVIEDYKYNLKSFKNRIEHKDINKIYLAALGSIPYLYLLGTLIRNGHIQNEILDYNRDKDKWYILDSIKDKLTHSLMYEVDDKTVEDKLDELCNSEAEAIGIALAYTFPINKISVPQELRDNTIYLTHSLGFGNDKLSDGESQASLLNELSVYIDKLKSANKKVHLFVSAQASICIKLGKRYQDVTMGEIFIHNYNGAEDVKAYDWYISFNKGKVS